MALLHEVGIVDPERRARAYPHELSGGMAQRVVIAMALVARPRPCCSPTTPRWASTPPIQVQVLDLLVARCRELGLGVVLITHDLGIVAHYCDRVAVMRAGRIVEIGPVAELPGRAPAPATAASCWVPPGPAAAVGPGAPPRGPRTSRCSRSTSSSSISRSAARARWSARWTASPSPSHRGETLALVGESGSGKTTVGQCLLRLLDPTDGQIVFDGHDVTRQAEPEFRRLRSRMQMVFQEPYVALNPRWRVASSIGEPLRLARA